MTGYSRAPLTRLIEQWQDRRRIAGRRGPPVPPFARPTARPARAERVPLDRLHDQSGSLGVDSVVRKHLGYSPIPSRCAESVSTLLSGFLTPYLNDHRPCFLSPETRLGEKGRQRRLYRYEHVNTPYERLKSIPAPSAFSTRF